MVLRVRYRLFKSVFNDWSQVKRLGSSRGGGLSYFHNPGTEPLHYLTIGQLVTGAAGRWPDTDVFVSTQHGTRLTFSQVEQQANKLAAGFLDLGLVPGDRLGICSPNSAQWFLTALAASKAGLILVSDDPLQTVNVVSMNPAYMKEELEYCLQKVSVRALVTDETYKVQEYYKLLCEIVPNLSDLPQNTKLNCSKLPDFSAIIVNSEKNLPGTFRFCDVLESAGNLQRLHEVQERLRPEHIGNIQFTSGTTGKPKAVPLSHFNLINNAYNVGKRLGMNKKHSKILAQAPFFHALGYIAALMTSFHFGSTMVLPSPTFSVPDSSEAIKREKCTMLLGTPTMYVDLCNYVSNLSAEEQLLHKSPEIAISGGSLCLPELFRKMRDTFSCERVVSVYGMTEITAVTFQSTEHDSEFLMTSTVGKISDHVEAKVVDEEGLTVPFGTPGELWMRSFNTMTGYWEDEEATNRMFTKDKWLKTGDRFILHEDGYGQVVGRIKDMIIRGGENISPKEVEEFLITHPDILDAQVIGVTSERLGEEVACSLRVKSGTTITEQQVKDYCKGKISYYKIPKYVEVVDVYPTTGSGKIQKFKIREAMEKKLGINK
ncbi:medium-chain acyl-CoA ligase ACSF2, mitochondrial isoform X1 [Homalodisca vitripennis]|uniref:medium-chain acyl-CoA ligase ACSF2, mitochondrial isoform X1 n=1 Tax=Homalodisca vitripennis TaxID=197043 RepID=UPI001EEBFCD1|nr:medium-chain acyl-CoA ligase ACSF2, mitochondrial isoform X1 [Homalodisca vitripennis]